MPKAKATKPSTDTAHVNAANKRPVGATRTTTTNGSSRAAKAKGNTTATTQAVANGPEKSAKGNKKKTVQPTTVAAAAPSPAILAPAPPLTAPPTKARATVIKAASILPLEPDDSQDEALCSDEDKEDELEINVDEFENAYGSGSDEHVEQDDPDDEPDTRKTPKRTRARRATPQIATPAQPARAVDSSPVTVILDTAPRRASGHVHFLEFTPYNRQLNPRDASKPLQSGLSPLSRTISQRSTRTHRANVISAHGFFSPQSRLLAGSQSVRDAARALDADSRLRRLDNDLNYQDDMVKLTLRTESTVRHEVLASARAHVPAAYCLGLAQGTPDRNKAVVAALLTVKNFTFRTFKYAISGIAEVHVTSRSGPYRHPIFQTIIQEQLFHQHERMAIDELTRGHFNPMPIGVLAIVATAVECALHDWSTGILERKGNTFTTDEWSGVYKKHVKALNTMKKIKPDMFAAWTRKLYMDCLETTKAYAALEESDDDEIQDEEMADYDDLDLRGFLPDPAVHASNT